MLFKLLYKIIFDVFDDVGYIGDNWDNFCYILFEKIYGLFNFVNLVCDWFVISGK